MAREQGRLKDVPGDVVGGRAFGKGDSGEPGAEQGLCSPHICLLEERQCKLDCAGFYTHVERSSYSKEMKDEDAPQSWTRQLLLNSKW